MSRPGFFFCLCPDSKWLKKNCFGLRSKLEGQWQQRVYWADEELTDALWQDLTLPDLTGGQKMVVLRRAEALSAEAWKKFSPVLQHFKPRILPIFCLEGQWKHNRPPVPAGLKGRPFWRLAQKRQWTWQSPGLTEQDKTQYLKKWASAKGIALSNPVLKKAAVALPLDVADLDNELEKLAILSQGHQGQLQEQDLAAISHRPGLDIFEFLSALRKSDADLTAWRTIFKDQLGSDAKLVFPFLSLLQREARQLWQLLHGPSQSLRLPDWARQEKSVLARRLGSQRLSRIWDLALEAESGIKSGERNPDQALEILFTNLTHLFRDQGGRW